MAAKEKKPMSLQDRLKNLGVAPIIGYEPVEFADTGSMTFNWMLGGGLPRGRVTNMWGDKHYGKSTLSLLCSVAATEREGKTAYFDNERGIDARWVYRLGVNPKLMELYQPPSAETCGEAIIAMAESNEYDLIVLDSVAGSTWAAEYDADLSDNIVGLAARKWGQFYRKLMKPLARSRTAVIVLNQVREAIGAYDPEKQPGGRSHQFFCSVEIKLLKPETKDKSLVVFRPKTKKNRHAQFDREAEIALRLDVQQPFVDPVPEITSLGKMLSVFTKEDGSLITGPCKWHLNGQPVATGEIQVQTMLYEDDDLMTAALDAVNRAIANQNAPAPQVITNEEIENA
jgi:protein RecA